MSNSGIGIKGRIKSKKGAANPTRTHAMRYALFTTSDFLLSASADATKKALSRASRIHFKADHQKILIKFIICHQDTRVTENIKTEQTALRVIARRINLGRDAIFCVSTLLSFCVYYSTSMSD